MCIADKSRIAPEILAYPAKHPDAEDTTQGIAERSLLEQRIVNQTSKVKEALTEFVANGLVVERKARGSKPCYRINRSKIKEISNMLKQTSE